MGELFERNDAKFDEENPVDATVAPTPDANASARPVAEKGVKNWWRTYNLQSIDGLPALKMAPYYKGILKNFVPSVEEGAFRAQRKGEGVLGIDEIASEPRRTWYAESLSTLFGGKGANFVLGVLVGLVIASAVVKAQCIVPSIQRKFVF
jgi:hypothetical protein